MGMPRSSRAPQRKRGKTTELTWPRHASTGGRPASGDRDPLVNPRGGSSDLARETSDARPWLTASGAEPRASLAAFIHRIHSSHSFIAFLHRRSFIAFLHRRYSSSFIIIRSCIDVARAMSTPSPCSCVDGIDHAKIMMMRDAVGSRAARVRERSDLETSRAAALRLPSPELSLAGDAWTTPRCANDWGRMAAAAW
jgi:hypothetical protein